MNNNQHLHSPSINSPNSMHPLGGTRPVQSFHQQVQSQQPQPQDWIDQINQDPLVSELRRWLNDVARYPQALSNPEDGGEAPKQPKPIQNYTLPNGDVISCTFWNGRFYITGTDIVKILLFRFHHIGRPVLNTKKFEEGVFSDLRNLKPGTDAVLEEPKSPFLEFLYKHNCIRTQKKQKVFFWYKVPHDALFRDAMERDLKREASLYQQAHFFNINQRMMRAPMTMMLASPGAAAANGLPAIAPQPNTAFIDPQALYHMQYATLASPHQAPIVFQQPRKSGFPLGSIEPSMMSGYDPTILSPLSGGPQPNISQQQQSMQQPQQAKTPQRDPLTLLDETSSLLSCDFEQDPMVASFSMDQFVDYPPSQGQSPRDMSSAGFTL